MGREVVAVDAMCWVTVGEPDPVELSCDWAVVSVGILALVPVIACDVAWSIFGVCIPRWISNLSGHCSVPALGGPIETAGLSVE